MSMVPYAPYPPMTMSMPAAAAANTLYGVGKAAYRNRRGIKRAARTVQKAYRKYKRTKQNNPTKWLGESPGVGNTKRNENHIVNNSTMNGASMYAWDLLELPEAGATNDIDKRQRDLVNISGCKIDLELKNTTATPIYLNVAVVIPKTSQSVDTTDFFRSYQGGSRGVNFDNATLNGIDYHRLVLNTDKYAVVMRQRWCLRGHDLENEAANIMSSGGTNYICWSKYINVKKQIRYDAAVLRPQTPMYLVMWCAQMFDAAPVATTAQAEYSMRNAVFFRETAN